ncbi:hypothetical protein ACEPAF_3797 [Sanghuangporus sanghuang]
MATDDDCYSLTVRPEDLLLACVAYSRPEMLALDKIISLHSQNALVLGAEVEQSKSIADLPVELLLRIRAELQSTLFASLKAEAAAALEQYQAALVEGICPDCFWWNSDVYGSDVWTWVENGYRGACSCAIVGDIDPRSPSETKRHILRKFQGIDIGTRGSWLRSYIQRTYLDEKTSAWSFARGILAQFGCKHRFERPQSQYPPSAPAATSPMPTVPEDTTTTTAISGQPEVKKTPRRITSCDFGALVRIFQRPERNESEEPEITLRRLLRELDLKAPADDEPSIALQIANHRFCILFPPDRSCTLFRLCNPVRRQDSPAHSLFEAFPRPAWTGMQLHGLLSVICCAHCVAQVVCIRLFSLLAELMLVFRSSIGPVP